MRWTGTVGESSFERKGGDTKDHALGQWFMKHSEAEDLSFLTAARQQVDIEKLPAIIVLLIPVHFCGPFFF